MVQGLGTLWLEDAEQILVAPNFIPHFNIMRNHWWALSKYYFESAVFRIYPTHDNASSYMNAATLMSLALKDDSQNLSTYPWVYTFSPSLTQQERILLWRTLLPPNNSFYHTPRTRSTELLPLNTTRFQSANWQTPLWCALESFQVLMSGWLVIIWIFLFHF